VRCFFLINVLHHIHEPAEFLKEAERCLEPGGEIVLVEPFNSAWVRWLYRNLNHYEFFDPNQKSWANSLSSRMENANMALPWIILFRDSDEFERRFPALAAHRQRIHTFIAYAISGGVTFKSLLPSWMWPGIVAFEWLLTPLMPWLATTMTVNIQKRNRA
jgi:SAM-dependent methyltransferase